MPTPLAFATGVEPWPNLVAAGWPAILIGNGASRAVSDRFGYNTLYKVASAPNSPHPMDDADREFFKCLNTDNFELVLGGLRSALYAVEAYGLGQDAQTRIQEPYDRIRRSLAAAVQSVHPPHAAVGIDRLKKIGQAIRAYDWVFSTNYDLLLYWAFMAHGKEGFHDYLGGHPCRFRAENLAVEAGRSRVLYLHGALHLFISAAGEYAGTTRKRTGQVQANLLAQLGDQPEPPLIIAEGSPADKMAAIPHSAYLRFAHRQLSEYTGALVIFGSALGPFDGHLVDEIKPVGGRRLAISVRGSVAEQTREMHHFESLFDGAELHFFHAGTHPLGAKGLRVSNWAP